MIRTIVYGVGTFWRQHQYLLPFDIEIIAYADSLETRATIVSGEMIEGKPILMPKELEEIDFDCLIIGTDFGAANRIFETLSKLNLRGKGVRFLARNMGTLLLSGKRVDWHYEVLGNGVIKDYIGDIVMSEQGGSDYDVISEVFGRCLYHITLDSETVLVDIGMNVGYVSLLYAQDANVVKVYGFEPFPDTYAQAIENFNMNDDKIRNKIVACDVALGDGDFSLDVVATMNGTARRSIYDSETDGEHVKIRCCDAGRIMQDILNKNKDRDILLKIDVEGAEYDIFKSMDRRKVFEKIRVIVMEFHGAPDSLINILKKYEFRCYLNGFSLQGMLVAVNTSVH